MAPRESVEFVIIRFTYVNYIDPHHPRICLTRRKHAPSSSLVQVRDWFDRSMNIEVGNLPSTTHIRFCEWRILTGDWDIFVMHKTRYDKIALLMGEVAVHWIFYQNTPLHGRLEGSGTLPISYCACCLNNHYLKILETIKYSLN